MWKTELRTRLECSPEEGKDLAVLSTLGVGGQVEFFVEPEKLQDVSELFRMRAADDFPLYVLGGGSNVLFADGELEGVVLSTRRLKELRWLSGDGLLEAEGGCSLSRVVFESMEKGLTGAEFAWGIPGTVGGAIAGNAGAGGRSLGDLLEEVTTVEEDGSIRKWARGEFNFSYRYFSLSRFFPPRLFASCRMRFERADRVTVENEVAAFRSARERQPQGVKAAGCSFKNPPGDSAGRLLDVCGCKGMSAGDAVVSDVHANFVINQGRAAASDIFELMKSCRDIVFRKKGILLEPEVKLLGFRM